MDDPIFDPWCLGDEARPTPPQRTSRWRGAAKGEGVPAPRPVPSPRRPPPDEVDELPRAVEIQVGPQAPTQRPAPLAHEPPGLLRTLLLPRVETLERRLIAARHRTTVDDRLDREPPALRLRIEPWSAPFDETEERSGAVLEVVHEGGGEGTVTASIWCDPTSSEPTQRRSLPAADVTGARIDELLFDFVETALR